MSMNRGPAVIGAPQFSGADGRDGRRRQGRGRRRRRRPEHPFLNPAGFSYPPGFPKGTAGATTPKVIVARGFAGAGTRTARRSTASSRSTGRSSPASSPACETDVEAGPAGLLRRGAGRLPSRRRRTSRASRPARTSATTGSSTSRSPLGGCCSANSPEIVAAFEAAVRDGMDVINFSGGGPQADPRTDALIQAVANVVRAGVVPIISAGNDRDFFGLGTAGSPATAPDAISVGATANSHVFGTSLHGAFARRRRRGSRSSPPTRIPPSWISTNQRLVDVGSDRRREPASSATARCRPARCGARSRSSAGAAARTARRPRARARCRRDGDGRSPRTVPAIRRSRSSPGCRAGRSPTSTARESGPRRPGPAAPSPCGSRREIARGADDLGRRADELLRRGADAVRARA